MRPFWPTAFVPDDFTCWLLRFKKKQDAVRLKEPRGLQGRIDDGVLSSQTLLTE